MSRTWTQAGAAAGIAGVAAAVATLPMEGASPKSSASASAVARYVVGHHTDLKLTGLLVVISAALLAWFAATLGWLIAARDRESPLGAIVLVTSAGMVVLLAWDGILEVALSFLASHKTAAPPPGISVLYELENGIVMPGAFGFLTAAFLVAVAAACLRGIVARPWVAYLSLVLAALSVVSGCLGLSSVDGGTTPLSFTPAIAAVLVPLILSVGLLRRPEREPRGQAAPSPAG